MEHVIKISRKSHNYFYKFVGLVKFESLVGIEPNLFETQVFKQSPVRSCFVFIPNRLRRVEI